MKRLLTYLFVTICTGIATLEAGIPPFVKVGGVYVFTLSDAANGTIIASVVKEEGGSWVKVSTVEKKDEIWINLDQVRTIVRVNQDADSLGKEMRRRTKALQDMDRQKAILTNLRMIAAAVDQYRLENGREPSSLTDIVGKSKYVYAVYPVAGEDYSTLMLRGDAPLRIKTPDGLEVSYPRK